MKKSCLFVLLYCALFSAGLRAQSSNPVQTDTIGVHDMRCGQCETRIHRALKKQSGISDSYADVETASVVVSYDPKVISRKQIEDVIVATGYGVGARSGDPAARKALPSCCK